VTLNVTNPAGTATLTKSNYVAVNPVPPPTVVFTANRTTVYPDEPILFTDQSTNDRFPLQSWDWSFGDGQWINQSVNDSVTYAYDEPGTYTVELFVTGYGGTASKTKTVTVDPIPVPTVAFTANKTTVYPKRDDPVHRQDHDDRQFPDVYLELVVWGRPVDQSIGQHSDGTCVRRTRLVRCYIVCNRGRGNGVEDPAGHCRTVPGPIVQFTANATTEIRPMSVQFTDLSTTEPFPWYWDFGDGYDSTARTPFIPTGTKGQYTVTLRPRT
jgi:PKD repeat protein